MLCGHQSCPPACTLAFKIYSSSMFNSALKRLMLQPHTTGNIKVWLCTKSESFGLILTIRYLSNSSKNINDHLDKQRSVSSLSTFFTTFNRRKRLICQKPIKQCFFLNEDVNICWQGCRSRTLKYSNGGVSATMLHGHQSSSGSARLRRHFTELHLNGAPHPPLYVGRVA